MPTTPTSLINRLMGQESLTDGISLPAQVLTLSAGTTIGGVTVDPANSLVNVLAATTTLTLTAALHANKTMLIQSTGGLAVTPPAATGTGATYSFFVLATVSGGSFTIDAKAGQASDLFWGLALQQLSGTGLTVYNNASNTNLITLNGSTTGGIKGDFITMTDYGTHVWRFLIVGQATGSVATPLSNH